MKKIVCEMCGASDMQKEDGVFVCKFCGCKYSLEEAKKLMIEGTVDVSGSVVKVDTSDELNNLYEIARRAKDDNNAENAGRYYDMILVKDPSSWEAYFYVVYFKAMQCKIAEIRAAAVSVANSVDTVLKLIRDNLERDDQVEAVSEVIFRVEVIESMLANGAHNHYDSISPDIKSNYSAEFGSNVRTCGNAMFVLGDAIENLFDDQRIQVMSATAWKSGIDIYKQHNLSINNQALQAYVGKIKKYDPQYTAPPNMGLGACYVATAVYGSYDCPEVWTLRRFRDYELAKTWHGRAFIHLYYAISPSIVNYCGDKVWFKKMWKDKLDLFVRELQMKGYESTPYEDRNWR